MVNIQWFPGHMAKARRQVQENLKFVDFVIELVDARLPFSSRNPLLEKLVGDKPSLLLLNKKDLSDPFLVKEWQASLGENSLTINSKDSVVGKQILLAAKKLLTDKRTRDEARGIQGRPLRTMIIGIPNVGKSTLINRLVGKKVTATANKPGVTKGQQWLRGHSELEILDTPGILWPKFEDERVGLKLALTGAIKDDLIPLDEVTLFGLRFFKRYYPNALASRFGSIDEDLPQAIMDLTREYGYKDDYDRFYRLFIKDVRDGRLGRYCLDRLEEHSVDGDS